MGLAQYFKFQYDNDAEIKVLLAELNCSFKDNLWIISNYNKKEMYFEIAIEKEGLYIHRNGDYFEFLGLIVEKITEKFGHLEIDDL